MTTNPISLPLAAGDGLEETPSGRMSSEWLDAVWGRYIGPMFERDFSPREFALLAEMQDVGPEEAAKRLGGEGE